MKYAIQRLINCFGYKVEKYPGDSIKRRMGYLELYNITKIFDVGANSGQFGQSLRKFGYSGKIISFEPLSQAFNDLEKNSKGDSNWIINNYAIGNENGRAIINVSNNSWSSSIYNILDTHKNAAPNSMVIDKEEIEMKKIDSIFNSYCNEREKIMMKIDTQGFEKNVINGAENSMNKIMLIQMEMSIVPLYENEMVFKDMLQYLWDRNFDLIFLEQGFSDPHTGHILQVDGIFLNRTLKDPNL